MPESDDQQTDWPSQATETIVDFVDSVKNKTTKPATMIARGLVYGIVIVTIGLTALIMLLIGSVHFLNQLIPQDVWLVYLIIGLVFTLGGMLLWRKRTA